MAGIKGKVPAAEIRNRQLLVIHASENRETKFSWYQSRPERGLIKLMMNSLVIVRGEQLSNEP